MTDDRRERAIEAASKRYYECTMAERPVGNNVRDWWRETFDTYERELGPGERMTEEEWWERFGEQVSAARQREELASAEDEDPTTERDVQMDTLTEENLRWSGAINSRISVCDVCNVVLARDGVLVEDRPTTMCSHLRGTTWAHPLLTPEEAKLVSQSMQGILNVMRGLNDEHQEKYGLPVLESAYEKIERLVR